MFVEVEGGGVALHSGGEGEDDFVDGGGDALLHALDEGVNVEVANADAVNGGNYPSEDVVKALVLLCVLNSHNILHVFHHADDALVALGAGADGAGVGVAEAVANVAVVDVGGEAVDGVGQMEGLVSGLFEQVEGETQGRAFAYTGQGGEVFDGVGQGVGGQFHWVFFV